MQLSPRRPAPRIGARSVGSAVDKKDTQRLSTFRNDKGIADALAGYARISDANRSARVVTSEITAHGIHRRARMAARVDSLFGPLSGGTHEQGEKSGGPSAYGLGSLPPVREVNAPVSHLRQGRGTLVALTSGACR